MVTNQDLDVDLRKLGRPIKHYLFQVPEGEGEFGEFDIKKYKNRLSQNPMMDVKSLLYLLGAMRG